MSPLPTASVRGVRAAARRLALRYPGPLASAAGLHTVAGACGLVAPWLLGQVVEDSRRGAAVVSLLICAFVVAQAGLVSAASYLSAALGERLVAELREELVVGILALPAAELERTDSGDLVTRTTRDVALLSTAVRTAVPDAMTAGTAILVGLGAMLLLDPRVAVPGLVGVPLVWLVARRYLARAGGAYLRESSAYSRITDGLAETVDGARTVEAFGLADRRVRRARRDVAEASAAERYTLRLRTAFLPCLDTATMVPVVLTLLIGGYLHAAGLVGVSTVTTATLYAHQLIQPVNLLLGRLEDLQLGGASMARLLGVRPGRRDGGSAATPPGEEWVIQLRGVRHAYQPGRDVLHGVDLEIRPGETLAVVGPSGAGKSTLGRLIAGIEAPRAGAVTVGGVALTALPPDELRRRVVLVRQEFHVFAGTLRENVNLTRPDAADHEIENVLRAVGAWDWAQRIGIDTRVGAGGVDLSPAQAQQVSLSRVVLTDPAVVVLDEATAMLDPRAARDLERSLAALITGRTVVVIAHRLDTARRADRVAVLLNGRIVELGHHDALVEADGPYAALWRAWSAGPARDDPSPAPRPSRQRGGPTDVRLDGPGS